MLFRLSAFLTASGFLRGVSLSPVSPGTAFFWGARGTVAALLAMFLAWNTDPAYSQGSGMPPEHRPMLFGYKESGHADLALFPQWLSVLRRHAQDDLKDKDCEASASGNCPMRNWQRFLSGIRGKPALEQIRSVNAYGNRKRYVLDIDNYGVNDYWETPREFLYNDGDCEDFAIFKYMSLRQLGFDPDSMRIVVLQDTNLRIPHAVLVVYIGGDALVLDSQAQEVISQKSITHYVPIFSINERHWWMHTP